MAPCGRSHCATFGPTTGPHPALPQLKRSVAISTSLQEADPHLARDPVGVDEQDSERRLAELMSDASRITNPQYRRAISQLVRALADSPTLLEP